NHNGNENGEYAIAKCFNSSFAHDLLLERNLNNSIPFQEKNMNCINKLVYYENNFQILITPIYSFLFTNSTSVTGLNRNSLLLEISWHKKRVRCLLPFL